MKFLVLAVSFALGFLFAVEAHNHTGKERDPGFDFDEIDSRLRSASNNGKVDVHHPPVKDDFMFKDILPEKPNLSNATITIPL
jgi:hypothetical protein